jgi:putative inorganic carbon (HCO3(-)) transporter
MPSAAKLAPWTGYRLLWFGLALLASLLCWLVPAQWLLLGLAAGAVLLVCIYQPLCAVWLALLLGPARAWLEIFYPKIPDPGQLGFGLLLATATWQWLTRRTANRLQWRTLLPFAFFFIPALLSLLNAQDLSNAGKEVLKWLQIVLTAMVVAFQVHRQPRGLLGLLAGIGLIGTLQSAWGIAQWGGWAFVPEAFAVGDGHYRAYGSFQQPNPFGGFLALLLPLAIGLSVSAAYKRRWWILLGLTGISLLLLAGVFVSYSRGAWLGVAVMLFTLLLLVWQRQRKWVLLCSLLVLLSVLTADRMQLLPDAIGTRLNSSLSIFQVYDVRRAKITTDNFSLIERLAHWQAALSMAASKPIFGVGIGNYDAAYPMFRLPDWVESLGHAHNIYLNMLAEVGTLGLLGYILFWGVMFWQTYRLLQGAQTVFQTGLALGLFGVWVQLSTHQLFDNLYVNNLHLYLGTFFGMLVWLDQPPSQRNKQ